VLALALVLLAEDGSALSGIGAIGAGWTGAGLLGGVLWWLCFKYLPAQDARLERAIEGERIAAKAQTDAHARVVIELVTKFDAAIRAEAERCDAARREARQDFGRMIEQIERASRAGAQASAAESKPKG